MSIDAGALEHELLSHRDLSGPSDPLAEESVSTVASPGTKLLVVDDAEPNRKLISLYLRRIGVHVTTARNGAEAVALASKNDFDAILLDMQMPIMDGYTAAAEIRKNGYEQPVIALTANAMSSDERKCLDAGCTAFLSKPISMTDLLAALSRLVPEQFYESDEDVSSRPPIVDESEDEQDNDAIIDSIAEMSREIEAVVAAESVVEPERTLNDDALIPSLPIDDSDMFEIVQSFVTKLDKRLVDMEDAFADADYPKLAADAHWLKGVGGTVGFAAFTAPAQTLVDEANLGDSPQRMRIVLDELKDLASRIYIPEPATV